MPIVLEDAGVMSARDICEIECVDTEVLEQHL